jgi:hypothetical protein
LQFLLAGPILGKEGTGVGMGRLLGHENLCLLSRRQTQRSVAMGDSSGASSKISGDAAAAVGLARFDAAPEEYKIEKQMRDGFFDSRKQSHNGGISALTYLKTTFCTKPMHRDVQLTCTDDLYPVVLVLMATVGYRPLHHGRGASIFVVIDILSLGFSIWSLGFSKVI